VDARRGLARRHITVNPTFQAISREAGIAAAHIGIGVSALEYANHAENAYYAQSFFALSIGFERTCKLAIVVDHALRNGGRFPTYASLRNFGHDLATLLTRADQVASTYDLTSSERLPRTPVPAAMIQVLSDFASNITRYYNLDFVTGAPRLAPTDSVHDWHKKVTEQVISLHYPDRVRRKHAREAAVVDALLRQHVRVLHTSETGAAIRTVEDGISHSAATTYVKPYTRMYVLQIARFLAQLMTSLSNASYSTRLDTIPDLSDFYRIFNNEDRYFRKRKVWSIYRL
jgi:hypothetical protein